jgi:hypothetical protein
VDSPCAAVGVRTLKKDDLARYPFLMRIVDRVRSSVKRIFRADILLPGASTLGLASTQMTWLGFARTRRRPMTQARKKVVPPRWKKYGGLARCRRAKARSQSCLLSPTRAHHRANDCLHQMDLWIPRT